MHNETTGASIVVTIVTTNPTAVPSIHIPMVSIEFGDGYAHNLHRKEVSKLQASRKRLAFY